MKRNDHIAVNIRFILFTVFFILQMVTFAAGQEPVRTLDREKTAPKAERRVALVIGNAAYQHAAKLTNPANDARDMAAALKELGFEVIYGEDQSGEQMKRLIIEFGTKLKGGGKGLFYYAGHGVQLAGKNYLIPVEIEKLREKMMEFDAVDVNRVLGEMDEAGNGFNIVILDACRNNPFSRSWRTAGDGLASISAPTGTFIAYSTAPNSVASDGAGRNGLYTQELLAQIRTPGVALEEVFKQVRSEVRKKSNNQQVPWESSSVEGVFYFTARNEPAVRPDPKIKTGDAKPVPTTSAELVARWKQLHYRKENTEAVVLETTAELSLNSKNAIALRMRSSAYYVNNEDEKGKEDAIAVLDILKNPASSDEYEARCYAKRRLEKFNEAILDCTRAISLDRTSSWAYNSRGIMYDEKKLYDLAIADYTKALEIDPKYLWACTNRGAAYHSKELYDLAIADFTRAMDLDPQNADLYAYRAHSYERKLQHDPAIRDATKGIELDPKTSLAYTVRCTAYVNKNHFDLAITDCTKALELDPKDQYAYNNRGVAYGNKQKTDLALKDFVKAVELDPTYVEAFRNIGVAQANNKQYDLAITNYTKAIELNSKDALSFYSRGTAYLNTQQYDLAIADFTKATEVNPKYADAYNDRGVSFENKQRYDLAIADYTKTIELDPNYVYAYRNRANAYYSKQQYDLEIADYTKTIELEPMYAYTYNDRGNSFYQKKQYDRAMADYSKAIELEPKYALAYRNRAVAYDAKGETALAAADRKKADELEGKTRDLGPK